MTARAPFAIASGFGITTGRGGLFALTAGERVERWDDEPTTGLAVDRTRRLLARASWSEDPDGDGTVEIWTAAERGAVRATVPRLREPHACAFTPGGRIAVVSTATNRILFLHPRDGAVVETWSPGDVGDDGDRWHINMLVPLEDARLAAVAFGRFAEPRGWADECARRGAGVVFELRSGADLLSGLDAPHDVLIDADGRRAFVCESGRRTLAEYDLATGQRTRETELGGWTRGLIGTAGGTLLVGISARRHEGESGHATVVEVVPSTLEQRRRWDLPCEEVFAICPPPAG